MKSTDPNFIQAQKDGEKWMKEHPGVPVVDVNTGERRLAKEITAQLTDEECARELSMGQIEEIFQSWRKQVEKDETAFLLWTNLLGDLRMAARKVGN